MEPGTWTDPAGASHAKDAISLLSFTKAVWWGSDLLQKSQWTEFQALVICMCYQAFPGSLTVDSMVLHVVSQMVVHHPYGTKSCLVSHTHLWPVVAAFIIALALNKATDSCHKTIPEVHICANYEGRNPKK